jgi:hypothetical protein
VPVLDARRRLGRCRAFVARKARRQGVMTELIEGYPIDTGVDGATRNAFPGILSVFLNAGFIETGRLGKDRAVVASGTGRGADQTGAGSR